MDNSGNGNHGLIYGVDGGTYSSVDRAFSLPGVNNNYVGVDDPTGFPTGDAIYSMSAWIWMNGTQPHTLSQIITFGSSWACHQLASMYVQSSNKLGADTGCNNVETTNAVLSDKTWHHVAIVKKGTGQMDIADFDLYVDGVLIVDKTSTGTGTQNLGTITGFSVGVGFTCLLYTSPSPRDRG